MPNTVITIAEPNGASGERIQLATPEETASLTQPPAEPFDFIRTYVKYADVIEAPPEAHEAVATQLLASALNPSVQITFGGLTIPLDLWVLLLSPSGFGRNTLVGLARPIVQKAGLERMLSNNTWGSRQAFYQDISEHLSGLFVWPELSWVLKHLTDRTFAGVKEWLTDRYDNLVAPDAIRYRTTGRKGDTPPIVFSKAPRLNILATSSFDWFTTNLSQEDTTGGFIPRWVVTQASGPRRVVPIPRSPDTTLIDPLGDHLSQASTLSGESSLSTEAEQVYREWYVRASQQFLEQPNPALAEPFFNRQRIHVVKLALIYQVSESPDLRIAESAMRKAVEKAGAGQETIFSLLRTGMNQEGTEVDRMAERVRLAGADGLSRAALTRAFQYTRSAERESRLSTLIQAETILRFSRQTPGRSAEILVHRDHEEEYTRLHPEERRF
jgi:hypothetical protein